MIYETNPELYSQQIMKDRRNVMIISECLLLDVIFSLLQKRSTPTYRQIPVASISPFFPSISPSTHYLYYLYNILCTIRINYPYYLYHIYLYYKAIRLYHFYYSDLQLSSPANELLPGFIPSYLFF